MSSYPVKIVSFGISIPDKVVTNDDLATFLDTSDEWIYSRTGIKERRVVSGDETSVDLGVRASIMALDKAKLKPEDLDVIVCATSAPAHLYPSTACEIQAAIGAKNAFGFDITAACTGFLYAMDVANAYISCGKYKNILIVATDTNSKFVDWKDRASCVLFGDAAGAMVLSRKDSGESDILALDVKSDGNLKDYIVLSLNGDNCPVCDQGLKESGKIQMLGKDVYKFVVSKMPQFIVDTIENADLNVDEINYLVPHQANVRIIEAMQSRLGFGDEKVICNIARYGNTSAASVPIALFEGVEQGKIKLPSKMILCAFGAGMTWGAAVVNISKEVFS